MLSECLSSIQMFNLLSRVMPVFKHNLQVVWVPCLLIALMPIGSLRICLVSFIVHFWVVILAPWSEAPWLGYISSLLTLALVSFQQKSWFLMSYYLTISDFQTSSGTELGHHTLQHHTCTHWTSTRTLDPSCCVILLCLVSRHLSLILCSHLPDTTSSSSADSLPSCSLTWCLAPLGYVSSLFFVYLQVVQIPTCSLTWCPVGSLRICLVSSHTCTH